MVRTREELEGHGLPSLQFRCAEAGLDVSGSRAELIDRLLEAEGQVSEPEGETEPETEVEPETEPETEVESEAEE